MVEGGGLENRCTRKGTGGSNPSLSANLNNSDVPLDLKQVVKRLARVVDSRCRGFALDGRSRTEQRATVAAVLGRDSGGDRLHALETAARVEKAAL